MFLLLNLTKNTNKRVIDLIIKHDDVYNNKKFYISLYLIEFNLNILEYNLDKMKENRIKLNELLLKL
jgi:hypothetical protein